MPGLGFDSGIAEGSDVPVYYDPLLAKVIAWAETRDLAIARLPAALGQFVIEGITTNIPFLQRILVHAAFRAGESIPVFWTGRCGPGGCLPGAPACCLSRPSCSCL